MNQYPDNVIKFPVSKRPAKNQTSNSSGGLKVPDSAETIAFLKEMLDVIDSVGEQPPVPHEEPDGTKPRLTSLTNNEPVYENEFLTLAPLKELDFDLFENKDTVQDSEILDRYLVALAGEIGHEATRKLARVIEEYVAEVADIAFAEGLTEGAIPFD